MDLSERLWAIEQIKQLKSRYFRLVDTKQWDALEALFTDDCRFDFGDASVDAIRTPSDLVRQARATFGEAITTHHGHMPEIEITSERTATGTWAMADHVQFPEPRSTEPAAEDQQKTKPSGLTGSGHYHEVYERGDDQQWRIAALRLSRLQVTTW